MVCANVIANSLVDASELEFKDKSDSPLAMFVVNSNSRLWFGKSEGE